MKYSYTFVSTEPVTENPTLFDNKSVLRKHLMLHLSDDTRYSPIIIECGGSSYYFEDFANAEKYLNVEDEE